MAPATTSAGLLWGDTCRTRYWCCCCCLPQGVTCGTSQLHTSLNYFIYPMKFKRAIPNRHSPSSKKCEHFHISSVFGRSLCSNSIGFKYFMIGTFWQKFSYDTNNLSLSLIFHLYFRFCVHRKIEQNQNNSYMKNELTTPTDIISTNLHQSCYEDIRIALHDFPMSLCTILGYNLQLTLQNRHHIVIWICSCSGIRIVFTSHYFSTWGAVHYMSRQKNFRYFCMKTILFDTFSLFQAERL
jgi:hypothetical protein